MKIALCQFDMVWEDKEANKEKISALIESRADKSSLDWLVFPEMALSGFSMDLKKTTLSQKDMLFFSDLARKYGTAVSFGAVEDGYNKLITLDKGGNLISSYSKIHLYAFGGEDKIYKTGETPQNFNLGGMSVFPAVCFDLRFPYLFWNSAAQTDVYVVVASWPARRSGHWQTLLRARAVENQCYAVGVNRTGKDPLLEYSGNSVIYDPLGKTVLDCGEAEGVHTAQTPVDKELVTRTRTRFPFIGERKPSAQFV